MAADARSASSRIVHALTAAVAATVILVPTVDRWTDQPLAIMDAGLPDGRETPATLPLPGPPASLQSGAIDTLPALVDAAAQRLMAEQHVPGTAVAIVHDGQVIALRAYGIENVETNTPVDAARTLFRVGSVTKPLTAVAVLQLVDDGKLDLFRDVRDYLPGLTLPLA